MKDICRGTLTGISLLLILMLGASPVVYSVSTKKPDHKNEPCEILMEIYKEVLELGCYENDDFIKREFHLNLDNNEKNKEEHVVVLIHTAEDGEKMTVQVTYFEPRGKNINIKHAHKIMVILCCIAGDKVIVEKCDYKEKELKKILQKILQGIKDKKEILKIISHKKDISVCFD